MSIGILMELKLDNTCRQGSSPATDWRECLKRLSPRPWGVWPGRRSAHTSWGSFCRAWPRSRFERPRRVPPAPCRGPEAGCPWLSWWPSKPGPPTQTSPRRQLAYKINNFQKLLNHSTFSIDVLLLYYTPLNHSVQAHIQINWTFAERDFRCLKFQKIL